MKKLFITSLICCCLYFSGFTENYYLSPSGDDNNAGTSPANAWRTFQKLNTIFLHPGDSVLLEGGNVFNGTIVLDADDAGTELQPVYIGSYGTGSAVIQAGSDFGIRAYNCAGISIARLIIQGSGVQSNTGCGIQFYMDVPTDLSFIRMENVEVSGFRDYGIQIGAWSTNNGFRNVQLRYVNCHDNGNGGMMSFGYNTVLNHKDFYVGNSVFHDNKGRTDITNTNTGSGIVLSGIEGATIEYCEAYNNGENNSNPSGGPVGIWFYLVKSGIIQYCESHHNRSGTADGGGFDLDGGSQNCIIQYCYSHDNAGPGYLLAEYGSGLPFTGNIIRYNISQNDARKSGAGAITFWGADSWNAIRQSIVHNNTVFISDANVISGTPSAVKLIGNNFSGAKLCNNIFYTSGSVNMLHADTYTDSTQLHFVANDYYAVNGSPVFHWVWNQYNSLTDWKNSATTQERRGSTQYGTSIDPLFTSAGTGNTIGVGQLAQMPALLSGYKLGQNSQAMDIGIDVSVFAAVPCSRDFFGNNPRSGAAQDAGAHECSDCYGILPDYKLQLTARKMQGTTILSWQPQNERDINSFLIQRSSDGRNFTVIQAVTPDGRLTPYHIADTSRSLPLKYFRVQSVLKNGLSFYSNVIRTSSDETSLTVSFTGNRVLVHCATPQQMQFLLFNTAGQLVNKESRSVPQGVYYYDKLFRPTGKLYLLKVVAASGDSRTIQVFE